MPTEERIARLKQAASLRQTGVVVLEDISDPYNAAAVFRSCDAFGIQQVWLVFAKTQPFDPYEVGKLVSSSASKWLDFQIFESIDDCADRLHGAGYSLFATVPDSTALEITQAGFAESRLPAVMLGNERKGLSARAIQLADRRLTIPMRGIVTSLNLSVTAAIFMHELTRQRHDAGLEDYYLTFVQQNDLVQSWIKR